MYKGKKEYIEKNGLVVFRLHDHWQSRKGDEMTAGLADILGWSKNRIKPDDVLFEIPSTTGEEVVSQIRKKLNLRGGLRAVGDRKAAVRRVMLYPGAVTPPLGRRARRDRARAGSPRDGRPHAGSRSSIRSMDQG